MANADLIAAVTGDFIKDASKENKGSWMVYGKCRYLLARAHRNNIAFQKMMEEQMRPYQWAIDRGQVDAIKEVANTILQKVYAKTILLAIEDVASGKNLDYEPVDGEALFTALPDFWDAVYRFAENGRNYLVVKPMISEVYSAESIKADSGN